MDNRVTVPGYKYYLAPDGSRPLVAVAFLDIEPADGAWVDGVCLPVDAAALERLDDRERNYERVDVSASVEPARGRTWAYVGREPSRERFAAAVRDGTCVVAHEYLSRVPATDGAPPVAELVRVDI